MKKLIDTKRCHLPPFGERLEKSKKCRAIALFTAQVSISFSLFLSISLKAFVADSPHCSHLNSSHLAVNEIHLMNGLTVHHRTLRLDDIFSDEIRPIGPQQTKALGRLSIQTTLLIGTSNSISKAARAGEQWE